MLNQPPPRTRLRPAPGPSVAGGAAQREGLDTAWRVLDARLGRGRSRRELVGSVWRPASYATINGGIAVGPSIVNGHIYVSSTLPGDDVGFGQTTTLPAGGGIVRALGLGQRPPQVWTAEVEAPKTFTPEECQAAVLDASDWPSGGRPTAECAACLCACNVNAAAQCDTCWLQAPCVVLLCSLSTPDELRACVGNNCQAKLITSFTFERSVEVAPCAIDCAATCRFL